MLELNLYPITGLYQELYNPDLLSMSEPLGAESGIDVFKNINSYFWADVLSEKTIDSLLDILNERKGCRFVKHFVQREIQRKQQVFL